MSNTYSKFFRAGANTGAVVLEQVLGALLDAGGAVRVLAVGVPLPLVLGRVVDVHGRALLLAHTVIVEVLAGLQMADISMQTVQQRQLESLARQ